MMMIRKKGIGSFLLVVITKVLVLWACVVMAAAAQAVTTGAQGNCPLNFTVLSNFPYVAQQVTLPISHVQCLILLNALEMVLSEYLKQTNFFLIPANTTADCSLAFHSELVSLGAAANINFETSCLFNFSDIARGQDNCQGIQQVSDLKHLVHPGNLTGVTQSCEGVLANANGDTVLCAGCIRAVSTLALDLQSAANRSQVGCQNYSSMYAAGLVNSAGPLDPYTARCLFYLLNSTQNSHRNLTVLYIVVGVVAVAVLTISISLFFHFRLQKRRRKEQKAFIKHTTDLLEGSMNSDGGLVWFTMDDIKAATHNFSRGAIIGSGGFGNVYKGVLKSGSEIAVKCFKNCSPAGDAEFVHEVEMISSVRHRNLVALKGCCVGSGGVVEGHQRIIILDFMRNGSLKDYLFNPNKPSLDWPTRKQIAIGMARGIAYLHYGAQPAIIHRDIKASNILLDEKFEAHVADFGLAKFTPEGQTHITTRVAGTFGYVSPEYALYGQVTEKSDVYSFGVVLLELISARAAVNSTLVGMTLITDWAWALVKSGNWTQILDERMENKGSGEDIERLISIALLCAHPHVAYRPTMSDALKFLEDNQPLPPIPDRPLPLTSEREEIESAMGSTGQLFSDGGFQSFTSSFEMNLVR
ncbi:unnamed protein product [Sphagnum jensenii]|uniref:Protein kinase domain-containing protein n=1 Tax=Sphagnum jensenii TaxID=128206 RepID=A0ABP0XEA2_9BRYO